MYVHLTDLNVQIEVQRVYACLPWNRNLTRDWTHTVDWNKCKCDEDGCQADDGNENDAKGA